MTATTPAAPQVTVGLPFLNCAATLRDAIRSVFAQTRGDWELILVDDGSTDASGRIAAAVSDARVRVVSDGVNRGLVHRLNQIATLARAPYLCRMDADDVMHPRRLEAQLAFLAAHPDVDVVGSRSFSIDDDGLVRGLRIAATQEDVASPALVLAAARLLHPSVMGRTAWFLANPYSPRFVRAEDHELWCRTLPHSRFAVVGEPLLYYREPSRPRVGSYVQSCRTDREIYRVYGPAIVGRTGTAANIVRSFAKEAAYRVAAGIGLTGWLAARHALPLAAHDRNRAVAVLERVRRTAVPGWAV